MSSITEIEVPQRDFVGRPAEVKTTAIADPCHDHALMGQGDPLQRGTPNIEPRDDSKATDDVPIVRSVDGVLSDNGSCHALAAGAHACVGREALCREGR